MESMSNKRHNPPGRQKHLLRACTGFPAVVMATLIIALLAPALGGPIKAPAKKPEAAAPSPSSDTAANTPAPGDADMLPELVRGPLSPETLAGQPDIWSSADGPKDLPRMVPQTASPLVDHARGAIVDLSQVTGAPSSATDAPWVDLKLAEDDPPGQEDSPDEGHVVILTILVLGVAVGFLAILAIIRNRRRQRRQRYQANIRRHRHRLRRGGRYRHGPPPPTDHATAYDSRGGKS